MNEDILQPAPKYTPAQWDDLYSRLLEVQGVLSVLSDVVFKLDTAKDGGGAVSVCNMLERNMSEIVAGF